MSIEFTNEELASIRISLYDRRAELYKRELDASNEDDFRKAVDEQKTITNTLRKINGGNNG